MLSFAEPLAEAPPPELDALLLGESALGVGTPTDGDPPAFGIPRVGCAPPAEPPAEPLDPLLDPALEPPLWLPLWLPL